jgi:hypothetical protein
LAGREIDVRSAIEAHKRENPQLEHMSLQMEDGPPVSAI